MIAYILLIVAGVIAGFGLLSLTTVPKGQTPGAQFYISGVACVTLGTLSLALTAWWPLGVLVLVFLAQGVFHWTLVRLTGGTHKDPRVATILAEIAHRADRQYRDFLDLLSDEPGDRDWSATPSPAGLVMARCLAMSFAVTAFRSRSQAPIDSTRLVELATRIASQPYTSSRSQPSLTASDVDAIASNILAEQVFAWQQEEIQHGPSNPGMTTNGFEAMVKLFHDALAESVGDHRYRGELSVGKQPQVLDSPFMRLDHLVRMAIADLFSMTRGFLVD